jgi:hypothetical protein
MEFKQAVAELVRDALHRGDLFDGEIFLTSPGVDLRQINGYVRAVDSVFGDGQQFTAATSLSKCLFFPLEAGVDHAQQTEGGSEVGLPFHSLFHFSARGGKGGSRFG